ncbi:thioredoxin family protein [Mycoplasmopsis ciconiae]|uniref:Thioredoxin n=1 Tax=Mycoplasmopsis ciconiae TaxID=561067 RepID=A0ABU7ML89_9BACT|nr:thioredoxin family protein [Mycoplasmopsis ciconiae]
MMKDIVKSQINEEEMNKGLKVVVFYATWCGPCRMYKSSLEMLSEKDSVDVYRVNIDEDRAFAQEMGVSSIPATFVYEDGKMIKSFMGYRPYDQLRQEIEKLSAK